MLGGKVQMFLSGTRALALNSARNQSTKTVTLIPGDGIGPEIAASVQRLAKIGLSVILHVNLPFHYCLVQFDIKNCESTNLFTFL